MAGQGTGGFGTPAWPPPPVRPGSTGDGTWWSPGYRSSAKRAGVAVAAVGATVIASAIGVLVDLYGVAVVNGVAAGSLGLEDATAFDAANVAVAIVQLGLLVVSGAAVIAWLSRAVENVPPLTGGTPRRGPRAAIGWWFVPIASFWIPYQVVADTMRRLRTDSDRAERLLRPWWATWVALSILGAVLLQVPQETLDDLRTGFIVTAVLDALYVASGILLVLVLRASEWRAAVRAHTFGLDRVPQPAWPAFVATPSAGSTPDRPPLEPSEGSDR